MVLAWIVPVFDPDRSVAVKRCITKQDFGLGYESDTSLPEPTGAVERTRPCLGLKPTGFPTWRSDKALIAADSAGGPRRATRPRMDLSRFRASSAQAILSGHGPFNWMRPAW